jgi:hypothetical protein
VTACWLRQYSGDFARQDSRNLTGNRIYGPYTAAVQFGFKPLLDPRACFLKHGPLDFVVAKSVEKIAQDEASGASEKLYPLQPIIGQLDRPKEAMINLPQVQYQPIQPDRIDFMTSKKKTLAQ